MRHAFTRTLPFILLLPLLAGLLSSAWPSPRAAQAFACPDVIVDGGFEAGAPAWHPVSAGGFSPFSQVMPHTGVWGVYLAGYNNADDRLSQEVTIPASATVTLRFWWWVATEETTHPWDTLDVNITASGVTTRLLRVTDGSPLDTWTAANIDLTAYAGQAVRLTFHARSDRDRPTDFFIDDVSIAACESNVTATSTPASMATATPSPTASVPPLTTTPTRTPAVRIYLPVVVR